MRLPVEWIKEYVETDAGAEEISDRLTMAGLEVEEKAESAIGPVLDIKVTPNRGDCLSVLGVARELRAAYGVGEGPKTQGAGVQATCDQGPAGESVRISIEDPDLCARYAGRVVRNLRVGPSPQWMQDRIIAAGMRPINNVVDVTNYVMLETGQPLHAFDFDTLRGGQVIVRRARIGEALTTLDGQERRLDPTMLVIADAERPIALAGVMGGGETEMTDRTTTLLLESAHFAPLAVRRTAKSLEMRTEASYRFERYVDPAGVVSAANRACELLAEIGAGEVVPGVVDVLARPAEERRLDLRLSRVSEMLGYEVTQEEVEETLQSLGFVADTVYHTPISTRVTFTVPSWRPDIVREIDLVEEVGRVLGYERIPETLPRGITLQGGASREWRFVERLRDLLTGAGLQEIVAHSLLDESPLEDPRTSALRVGIRSALSAELSGLRRSLLPGLIETLDRNARRGLAPLAFCEIGRVFHRDGEDYSERFSVGAAIAGPVGSASWQKEGRAGAADFYTARGLVEMLGTGLHIAPIGFTPSADPRMHPGRSADVLLDGEVIGRVGELHPKLTRDLTVRQRVVVLELAVEPLILAQGRGGEFRALTPFPSVVRDLAPRLASDVSYRSVERAVESVEIPFLERVVLTDLFTGAPLQEGMKSLTLSLTFRAPDRTLTEDEVNGALDGVRQALERDCGAVFVG